MTTSPIPGGLSDERVERVARAIATAKRASNLRDIETIDRVWPSYCGQARAAIVASDEYPPNVDVLTVLEHLTELFVDLAPLGADTEREVAVINARRLLDAARTEARAIIATPPTIPLSPTEGGQSDQRIPVEFDEPMLSTSPPPPAVASTLGQGGGA